MHWNAGLIGHLRTHFPTMFCLYLILKDCDAPPTVEEQEIASGRKADAVANYLGWVETASANILSMFAKQQWAGGGKSTAYFWYYTVSDWGARIESGIKRLSNIMLPSGLLHVTSHLMRSTNPNSAIFSNTHTCILPCRFLTVMLFGIA